MAKNLETISTFTIEDLTNFCYRVTNILEGDFMHIEEYLSEEFKQALYKEREKWVDESNKRDNLESV